MATIETAIRLHDNVSNVLYQIVSSINLGLSAMSDLNQSMSSPMNTGAFDAATAAIDNATAALREMGGALQATSGQNVTVATPVQPDWQSYNGLEVFQTAGVERYRQEIASVQNMLNELSASQNEITQQAVYTEIIPYSARADMEALNNRIHSVQQRMQLLSNTPVDMRTAEANSELERLRRYLEQALQTQNDLNSAMGAGNLSATNAAYQQLNSIMDNCERHIRDNVNEQGRFTQEISNSTSSTSALMNKIKGVVGAYVGIQGVKKVFDLSDEITSTTARLKSMNDGAQSTADLFNMVYASAEDARGSFSAMTSLVSRLGNNAGDAFSSNQEIVAFSNLIQKQMAIAGTSTTEASNAMLQLSQALGSGVLRGDELNSIFEQAPNIIQTIAEYMDVTVGEIRNLASEGQITADIIKNAMFDSADEINAKFNDMPKTWGQVWQSAKNKSIIALQPVLDKISELANNAQVQEGITAIIDVIAFGAEVAVTVIGAIASAAGYVVENWEALSPIFIAAAVALGVFCVALTAHKISVAASTLAQQGFNISLVAFKALNVAAVVLGIVTAVSLLTSAINSACGTTFSFAGMLGGILMTVLATLGNAIYMIWDIVATCVVFVWNIIADLVNFLANVFTDPLGAIARLFFDVFDSILGIIEGVAGAIGNLFGKDWSSGIAGFRAEVDKFSKEKFGTGVEVVKKLDPNDFSMKNTFGLDYIKYDEAMETGYYMGEQFAQGKNPFSTDTTATQYNNYDIYQGVEGIYDNTTAIKDGLDVTNEELKYLRDLAEMEVVNRFTTAEIHIEQTNNNTVSGDFDLDGIVNGLVDAVNEAVDEIAEGVHA